MKLRRRPQCWNANSNNKQEIYQAAYCIIVSILHHLQLHSHLRHTLGRNGRSRRRTNSLSTKRNHSMTLQTHLPCWRAQCTPEQRGDKVGSKLNTEKLRCLSSTYRRLASHTAPPSPTPTGVFYFFVSHKSPIKSFFCQKFETCLAVVISAHI